jgi:hypothetical protein
LEFVDNHAHNGKEINLENMNELYDTLLKEKMINEGNFLLIETFYEKLLAKKDIKFCYVGDHILNDCLYLSKEVNHWKVVLISNYLKPNSVEIHKDYAEKWGNYFHHREEETWLSTYSHKVIKDNDFFVIPNIEAILLLFDSI